jgi:hypothetical protein
MKQRIERRVKGRGLQWPRCFVVGSACGWWWQGSSVGGCWPWRAFLAVCRCFESKALAVLLVQTFLGYPPTPYVGGILELKY